MPTSETVGEPAHTHGSFNYRVASGDDADPVRAQGDSIVRLASLFKKHMRTAGQQGGEQKTVAESISEEITNRHCIALH